MTMEHRQLNLVADLYGCPNRCRHCWLGHMPNRDMGSDADRFLVDYFSPFFEKIAFYSWLREPDFCRDYPARWRRDLEISKNAAPERFELASFYRIVRDPDYIPFLKAVGVPKVQLTLFGLRQTQDAFVGRKGAFDEVMQATQLLIDGGIVPRWQCFLYETNIDEIAALYDMAQKLRQVRCPELEFFVHEGTCDGENRKLYPIRIEKRHIPAALIPVYLGYDALLSERECCERLRDDPGHPRFHNETEITLMISNNWDVYFNFTHMTPAWVIGNLKTDDKAELIRRIVEEDSFALRRAGQVTFTELTARFGDANSEKAFSLEDYQTYLFNCCLEA